MTKDILSTKTVDVIAQLITRQTVVNEQQYIIINFYFLFLLKI